MFEIFKKAIRGAIHDYSEKKGGDIVAAPLPLGLRCGGVITLDTIPFRMLADKLLFTAPENQQPIVTRGEVNLGALAKIHRFYLEDDAFIQVNTTAGSVDDIKCFVFFKTISPTSQAELDQWGGEFGLIGKPEMEIDGISYQRVWGDTNYLHVDPIHFIEDVYAGDATSPEYSCKHYCMLYERELENSGKQEYLLVSAEETDEGVTIVFSIDVDITLADLKIN